MKLAIFATLAVALIHPEAIDAMAYAWLAWFVGGVLMRVGASYERDRDRAAREARGASDARTTPLMPCVPIGED